MKNKEPKYRLHKASGQAVVVFNGKATYLGRYGSTESKAEYDRLIAEWKANGRQRPAGSDYTIVELIRDYLAYADGYYIKNGKPTSEPKNIELATRPLRDLHGHTPARTFGPLGLQAVRDEFIKAGMCRSTVNARTQRITRMFRWAVAGERVPASVLGALQAVAGLRRGRCQAPDHEPVGPVAQADVDAVKPLLSPPVRAIVGVMELTGARCDEVCQMTMADLDRSKDVWIYTPSSHKTEHHDKTRKIPIGPKAQEVLKPWFRADPTAPLFSPRRTMEGVWTGMKRPDSKRKPRPSERRKEKPKKAPGGVYTTDTVRQAIRRACDAVGIEHWRPHQLRHSYATRVREQFGLEMVQTLLGHSDPKVTEIYAQRNMAAAAAVALKIG
jgi:integrase